MSDRFGVSQSTYHNVCCRVAEAIVTDVMPRLVSWPVSDASKRAVSEGFRRIGRLPNTLGAVDGTHIRITAPREFPQSYFNRKHFYSMQLQGVCTSNLLFTHVLTGWPGSVHDARVFRNCSLMGDDNKFPPGYYLLGDSAYPLLRYLITPFRDYGNLGFEERRFNQELSRQRNVIERAFGHLKGRFLRLQFFRAEDTTFLCKTILATCTLHNVCIIMSLWRSFTKTVTMTESSRIILTTRK
ncbi:putative nuclease HARBI1 [Apostichopus japonicus]|uniref:putative nuclease HARBI1 n=1 Tax=Stichopus japonicus TaxID=307972 RepID=UPI003AB2500D